MVAAACRTAFGAIAVGLTNPRLPRLEDDPERLYLAAPLGRNQRDFGKRVRQRPKGPSA